MKGVLAALLILVTYVQPAWAQSPDLWDRLAELRISEDIELVDMSQHRTHARFAGYSKDAILVDTAGRQTSVPRTDVCMVNRLEATHRGRKIWLYPLVGASAGATMGALGWSQADVRGSRELVRNFTWVGAVTGLSLGAKSRSEPVRFAIYKGNCTVEYRPDVLLPVMELYGGFSLANIQTGATPAGGFEVGHPSSARRIEPGGVFSMAFPVNEHLRLIAGEFSGHTGDSGLTGLSKPARRVDGYYLMAGPEVTSRRKQWIMFGHLLGGFAISDLSTPDATPTPIVLPGTPIPETTTLFATDTGTALMIGGGADIDITRWLAFRTGQLDFVAARVRRDTAVLGEYTSPWWQYNWKLSTGLVIRVLNEKASLVVRDPRRPLPMPAIQSAPDKPESRWLVRMAYGSAINVVEELGILLRKPDHIGGAVIGFKDAAAWELSADFNVTQSIALRAGYQISSLDFGTDSTQLGTALYHMPKIGLLYTHQERRGRLEGGLLAGPNYYTGIRKSQAATDTFGIQDITPGTTGYHIGPVVDLQWNLKRTGILLGCGFFLPLSLSKAAVMRIETSPDSAFESGDARFGPIVLSVTVGYQFP